MGNDQIRTLRDRLDDLKDDRYAAREQRIRAEARHDRLEAERDRLEQELRSKQERANEWENRYNEANGKLTVHTSEKGLVARTKAWVFGSDAEQARRTQARIPRVPRGSPGRSGVATREEVAAHRGEVVSQQSLASDSSEDPLIHGRSGI